MIFGNGLRNQTVVFRSRTPAESTLVSNFCSPTKSLHIHLIKKFVITVLEDIDFKKVRPSYYRLQNNKEAAYISVFRLIRS